MNKGKNVPYSLELSIMWKSKSLYNGDILPKESLFLYLTFLPKLFFSFSLFL